MIDIIFVAYNSEKWIIPCMESIAASEYDLTQVSIYVVDNHSTDRTLELLEYVQEKYRGIFANFCVKRLRKNSGFGIGNNEAVKLGNGDILFFLNIDTEVYSDTLSQIERAVSESRKDIGLWELRQLPYEHPKLYDPISGETTWSSGACFVMRRPLFEQLGGFDRAFFMYCEDVDLSWRVRAAGYRIRYIPQAAVDHFSYQKAGEVKPLQWIYSIVNNRLLRCRFGTRKDIVWWDKFFCQLARQHGPFPHARRLLFRAAIRSLPRCFCFRIWGMLHRRQRLSCDFKFYELDYERIRDGAFCESVRFEEGSSRVSILVRTCGRPTVLRETLISLRNQTYPNLEVIVVEDGAPVSEKLIQEEFSDLNLRYCATGEKKGRCYVGNLALSMATGDYLNFLDDDDLLYADHVETLVYALQSHPKFQIAYSFAFDTPIDIFSKVPYWYKIEGYNQTVHFAYDPERLHEINLFPIQAVMFSRAVYESFGGFDETLETLEDWELWQRYATGYPYLCVPRTTSVYRVPGIGKKYFSRNRELQKNVDIIQARYDGIQFAELPVRKRG